MCSLNFIGNHSEPCVLQFIYSSWLSIHGKMVYICIRIQHVGVVCKLHYFFYIHAIWKIIHLQMT